MLTVTSLESSDKCLTCQRKENKENLIYGLPHALLYFNASKFVTAHVFVLDETLSWFEVKLMHVRKCTTRGLTEEGHQGET